MRIKKRNIGDEFERQVASMYRELSASVEHDVVIEGSQFDLIVTETSSTGPTLKRAVECKSLSGRVGIDDVRMFKRKFTDALLKGLIENPTMVSRLGFTPRARQGAQGITLLAFEELELRVKAKRGDPTSVAQQRVLDAMRNGPLTSIDMARKFGTSARFVDDTLRALERDGLVKELGGTYRLP